MAGQIRGPQDQAGPASRNGTKQNRGEAKGFVRSTEAKARSEGGARRSGQIRGPPRKGLSRTSAVEQDHGGAPPMTGDEEWSRLRSRATQGLEARNKRQPTSCKKKSEERKKERLGY
jgi:hypothetical protein